MKLQKLVCQICRSGDIVWLFISEAGGGLLLGCLLGYTWFLYALKSIDNYMVEVMITLAIVMGGYSLAE